MAELKLDASLDNLNFIKDFIQMELLSCGCSDELREQVDLAVDEIYVSIADHACQMQSTQTSIRCEVEVDPLRVTVEFVDSGKPYFPLTGCATTTLPPHEEPVLGVDVAMVKSWWVKSSIRIGVPSAN